MKISLTAEEVSAIVLEYMRQRVTWLKDLPVKSKVDVIFATEDGLLVEAYVILKEDTP